MVDFLVLTGVPVRLAVLDLWVGELVLTAERDDDADLVALFTDELLLLELPDFFIADDPAALAVRGE